MDRREGVTEISARHPYMDALGVWELQRIQLFDSSPATISDGVFQTSGSQMVGCPPGIQKLRAPWFRTYWRLLPKGTRLNIYTHTLGAPKHKNVHSDDNYSTKKTKKWVLEEKDGPKFVSHHSKTIQYYYLILDNISTKVPHWVEWAGSGES